MQSGGSGWMMIRSLYLDPAAAKQRLRSGTVRRIASYARPYRLLLTTFLIVTSADAVIVVANPLLFKSIVDNGIVPGHAAVVLGMAGAVAALALLDGLLGLTERWLSARIGEGLIFDLRSEVFRHVQRQPIAFFTRTQTGALVSRLNGDVIGAQAALTGTLSSVVSNAISVAIVLGTMIYLSPLVTVVALALLPVFIIPARLVGRRIQRVTREQMALDAEMGSTMTERFNVAGALLVKLYGHPEEEHALFAERARRVRDIGVVTAMYGQVFFTGLTMVASLATALVYGLGGNLVIHGAFQIGTLVALAALLMRLYGPLTALSNVQVDVMTALVSFDRVFEVLDLDPTVREGAGAVELPAPAPGSASAPSVEFEHVCFRYPSPDEVSLASLESVAVATGERGRRPDEALHDVSFQAAPGRMVALVGPSGAGKTTITHLVARLYDATTGSVRIGGHDVRDVTLDSLRRSVGVVTQDAHLFHDTIRGNLSYGRPAATEVELIEACRAAQIWDLISDLPDGLDTTVGDRGYRLSGGEKQRLAIARLLLKAPSVVVLDEATAHLDSESERAVQQALRTALSGRTALVIAHRLATIKEADLILVLDRGRIRERGTHPQLLAAGGLYRDLYRTQFAMQEPGVG